MNSSSEASSRGSSLNTWLLFALLCVAGALLYRQIKTVGPFLNAEPRSVTARGDLATDEKSTIEIFREAAPSVVHITSVAVRQHVFTMRVLEIPAGTGSGFIWDEQGHIVTNLHVVRGAQRATVTLADNTNYEAELVGYDVSNDLAVLEISAPPGVLKPIAIGESHNLQVGQKVFAIGSPFEFDHTLTTGVIGGLNRSILTGESGESRIHGAIQTDAAINPGNSGGPLLDSAGRLIGVNTAIVSESGGSNGIGFAIPVDVVNLSVPDLIRDGRISRPWLGVYLRETLGNLRLPGVMIEAVIPGGPAEASGLLPIRPGDNGQTLLGDLIIGLNNEPVRNGRDLLDLLSQYRESDEVKLAIVRDNTSIEIPVILAARPEPD